MASSSSPAESYGARGLFASYSESFAAVPRLNGIAAVTVGPVVPDAATRVVFAPREKGAAPASAAAADAERESVVVSYGPSGGRVLTASIGPAADVDVPALRKAAVAAVTKLRALKITDASVALPAVAGVPTAVSSAAIVQATVLTNFGFDRYITLDDKKPSLVQALHFAPPAGDADADAAARTAAVLADATIFARDLANERADELHPARLEAVARAVAAEASADVFVCAGEDLLAQGLHLLHAVGQSARHAPRYVRVPCGDSRARREDHQLTRMSPTHRPPAFPPPRRPPPEQIELSHKGDPESPDDVILLVGKGITFDSGGLNIKPTGSMENMHMDMGGSAAVLGAFKALTALGVKRNVVAVLAVAENAIGEHAFKPHNILRSHKGLTVEIKNTDAEGRLVLADALSFAQARVAPHTVIDLATLTGACVIALGEYAAGLFGNNASLRDGLMRASGATFERLWPMPIFPEHREEIRAAAMADLQSTGAGRYGGSCTAAAFLEFFIGGAPGKPVPAWAHLDIAGPAMQSKARGHFNADGTGFGVHVIAEYVLSAPKGAPAADEKTRF